VFQGKAFFTWYIWESIRIWIRLPPSGIN
jgi:hypothetical protein